MTGQVVVVAHWQVTAESLDTVLELLPALREASLAEPGCVGYEVLRSTDDPHALVLIERYHDDAAVEAHAASEHYQQVVVERIRPLLADRRVERLSPM